ncbi:MAG: LuxR C-terminal-related transcriptional regulator [Calditrichia bacterium]
MSKSKTSTFLLLETKLYRPKWRSGMVQRPRLAERLQLGSERKLTLISAPAGFGKTTLLAEWLATAKMANRTTGWVSLDAGDNDPISFWTYFIKSIQNIQPSVGENALTLLHSPQPAEVDEILPKLINEISAIESDFSVVLDDYHLIEAEAIQKAMTFLLDHTPAQMHLVIASRTDPPLPLAKLRARGELVELRIADMRFEHEEATSFFSHSMGLTIPAKDVVVLETRTEGWIAGLQLAALSLQGRDNMEEFIADFSGDDRYIGDYLVEEVLHRQQDRVRDFLLQTSILARLSGELCYAVTGEADSKQLLEELERGNLFVVPLDDKRQWYRYHHLFAEVINTRLKNLYPDDVSMLHRRASEWYQQNSQPTSAVYHAFESKDFEFTASVIELAWTAMRNGYKEGIFLSWMKRIPEEFIQVRPVLSVVYAWALMDAGELEAGELRLDAAEKWLELLDNPNGKSPFQKSDMVVTNKHYFNMLAATIASARGYLSLAFGDVPATINHTKRALMLFPKNEYYDLGAPAALLGLAYWSSGDLTAAYRSLSEGMEFLKKSDNALLAISGTFILAEIILAQGRLRDAITTYQQSLLLAEKQGETAFPGTVELHVGLSELYEERGESEVAAEHLAKSKELGTGAMIPGNESRLFAAFSRLKAADGFLDEAMKLLNDAEQAYRRDPVPDVRPIGALKARVLIKQGRLGEALSWVRDADLSVVDELHYMREFEHITLARILLALYIADSSQSVLDQAVQFLQRLLEAAEAGARNGSVLEILILQALVYLASEDKKAALSPLARALEIAEPEGYVRSFTGEGEPMRELLRHAVAAGFSGDYARRLLTSFEKAEQARAGSTGAAVLLTARELEIVRLIAAGLKNQQIADHLVISLHTVKRHIANAYGKLEVSHRTEAIAKATDLGLL